MSYENDGYMGYVLTVTYDNGLMATRGSRIYGDREQVQSLANCLTAKAKRDGTGERFGVGGIKPAQEVPISADYSGPFHNLDDACDAYEVGNR
jgi:hypothetical protein